MLLNLHPHSVVAAGVVLPTLASVAVGLRFYARHRIRVALREDDWTVLASVILVWGLGITNIVGGCPVQSSTRGSSKGKTGAALGALGAHSKPAGPDAPHHNTITRTRADIIVEEVRISVPRYRIALTIL